MSKFPDISHHHPVTDWSKLTFPVLISKATEGTSYTDPTLKSFISNCESRGIPYWLYTFLRKGNESAQVRYMVNVCKPLVGKHFVGYILDVESNNAVSDISAALNTLRSLWSGKTMIYTMYAQYSLYKSLITSRPSSCAWWEARYGSNNGADTSDKYPAHSGVDLLQYTDMATVPGLSGHIDMNKTTGTKPLSWFTGSVTAVSGSSSKSISVDCKAVVKGDKGACVKAMQILLSGYGYKGKNGKALTIDGDAGDQTMHALGLFQSDHNLTKDYKCEKLTWKRLLNG